MTQNPLPVLGTLAGAILTVAALVAIDTQVLYAQETDEQDQINADLAERARNLVERFTQQREEPDGVTAEPTEGIEEKSLSDKNENEPVEIEPMEEPEPMELPEPLEPFDPGPMETFTDAHDLEEPVDDLPDSGFGLSIAGVALGLTAVKQRKRLSKYVRKS